MSPVSPEPARRPPHPLALDLIERLADRPGARVLEVGSGSGRNTHALVAAGFAVSTLPTQEPCVAGLSTHALLHGTPRSIGGQLSAIADALEPEGLLFATFGSVRDARYGVGEKHEAHVYAPREGDEIGVMHAYFDTERLQTLLAPHFSIESMREVDVDDIAGTWAHATAPLRGAVHWFVVAARVCQ
ncbi:MAG: hypothetical protein WBA06_10435 [Candidatus Aquilonibacter sp.]